MLMESAERVMNKNINLAGTPGPHTARSAERQIENRN